MKKMTIGKLLLTLLMIMIVVITSTYAWFSYQSKKSALVLTIGDLNDSQVIITPYEIRDTMLPVNTYSSGVYSQITVINNNDSKMNMELYYKVNTLPQELAQNGLKYTIVQSDNKNGTYNEVLTGDFSTYSNESEIDIFNITINSNTTTYYRLYLWLDTNYGNQTILEDTKLDLELNANISRSANPPVLDSGMIPVTISNDGTVTTISSDDDSWYDYSNQKWANAILVTESSRSNYLNTTDVVVQESDILGYYVWIPRFRYKIWTTSVSSADNEQEIDIIFENKNTPKSNGTTIGSYLTHPAFTFGNQELSGFWVGKFETTGTGDNPTVLPNLSSLRRQNVSTHFQTSLKFAGGTLSSGNVTFIGSNTYGLTSNTDSHMMKNSEWGAVAYLSHSKYGINEEIYINNSSGFYTGRSGGNVGGSVNTLATQFSDTSDSSSNTYNDYGYYTWLGQSISSDGTIGTITNSALGTKASTTGNVTGIYDMSGGGREYIMAFLSDNNNKPMSGNSSSSNTGFNGTIYDSGNDTSYTSGIDFPLSKYYDLYLRSQFTGTASNNMSFCTLNTCGGHASYETFNWYGDYNNFVTQVHPVIARGGSYSYEIQAGIFSSVGAQGAAASYSSFRSVLIPVESYKVSYVNNFFTTSNQTISGVTVSYDATTSYLTLNGTQTAGIGLMRPDFEFKEGDKYKFTLTYVSGSFTANGSYAIGLDAATSNLSHTSTRNYAQMSFPTQGSNSVILTINSAAEEEASKLNNWIWQSSSGTLTYDNYVVKIEVTKVIENNIQYKDNYVLPSTPSKTGYTFLGWYTSPTGGTKITNSTVMNMTNDHSLYAQWRINKVYFNFHVNNGTILSSTTSSGGTVYTWTTNNGIIYRSVNSGTSTKNFLTANYNKTDFDLPNWDNSKYISISRTGYTAKSGEEWICTSGCSTTNKVFSDTTNYSASDFCDATNGDCTVVLKVNWESAISIPTFTYTGTYQIVDDNNNTITNTSTYTGNWKIRFLTDGTLKITDLKGAANGVDIFLVGGGGTGGSQPTYCSSSPGAYGGGGGAAITVTNFPIAANTSYTLDIGAASSNTIFKKGTTAYYTALCGGNATNPDGSGSTWNNGTAGAGGAGRLSGETSNYGATSVVAKAGASGGSNGNYEFFGTSGKRYGAGGGTGANGKSSNNCASEGYSGSAGGADGGGTGGTGGWIKCLGNDNYSYNEGTAGSAGTDNTGSGGGGGGGALGYDCTTILNGGSGGTGGSGIIIIRNHR